MSLQDLLKKEGAVSYSETATRLVREWEATVSNENPPGSPRKLKNLLSFIKKRKGEHVNLLSIGFSKNLLKKIKDADTAQESSVDIVKKGPAPVDKKRNEVCPQKNLKGKRPIIVA